MTYRVLVVCTGNICRSPMGESLLRDKLEAAGVSGIEVSSAGTGAWDGAPASEGALLVALENGLDLSQHTARLITRDMVSEADLILTMSRHHKGRVEELGGDGKTHLLGEFAGRSIQEAEVADPFGGDLEVYRRTFGELDQLVDIAVTRLARELAE